MKQETTKFKSIVSCVIGLETDDFFWLLELFQVQVTRQCGQPMITFSERSRLFDRLFLRKLRLLQWLCFTCICILGIEKPKNSCCCCSELIINEIMELGFDFTSELGVKVVMKTDIHPSSPTVAGECFVLQRRSCCCCSKRKAASMLFSLFLFYYCFFALFFCLYFLSKNN